MDYFEEVRSRYSRSFISNGLIVLGWAMVGMTMMGLLARFLGAGTVHGYRLLIDPGISPEVYDSTSGFGGVELVFPPLLTTLAIAVVGALVADRLGPWTLRARLADPSHGPDTRIKQAFDDVALAIGQSPIVYVVDDVRVDVAAFGRRGDRPVVVATSAAATLDRHHLDGLAALGLAESLIGGGAAGAWRGLRLFVWVPVVLARGWWLVPVLVWLGQFPAVALLDPDRLGEALGATLSTTPFVVLFATVIYLMTTAGMTAPSAMSHTSADIGAVAILRHPEQWRDTCVVLARRNWQLADRGLLTRADWLAPVDSYFLDRRHRKIRRRLPAVGLRLDDTPLPADVRFHDTPSTGRR